MREATLRAIEAEYAAIREQNRAEERRRLDEVTASDPAIGALAAARFDMLQNRVRQAFGSPDQAIRIGEAFQRDMAALQEDIRARLVAAGYAADYLQPVYRCANCRDKGFVGEPVMERCACFLQKARAHVSRAAGSGVDPSETFEAFDPAVFPDRPLSADRPESQRAYMERIRARCEAFADQYPANERRNLLLFGGSGLGKTYLMNCIGNRVRARGMEAVKLTAYQMTERMRASIFQHQPEAFAQLLDAPLLLLDDLGAEPLIANVTIEELFTLLNERGLRGHATVISTNLMLNELRARYTERITSRLFDRRGATLLEFLGTDVRLR